MKTFKKWNRKTIEDWGIYCSDEYKSYARAFKNFLKRSFPDAQIVGFKANHYDTSGFIVMDDKIVYVSQSMDRGRGYHDFNESDFLNGVLYRTAESTKDYHGGPNHFASVNGLIEGIKALI